MRPKGLGARFDGWIESTAGVHAAHVNWHTFRRALDERSGMPVSILKLDVALLGG